MLSVRIQRTEASMNLDSITHLIEKEIDILNKVLRLLTGTGAKTKRTIRRKISAAGRKRIAAAQRKRWAKIRAGMKK